MATASAVMRRAVEAALRSRPGTRQVGADELAVRCLEPEHEDERASASWSIPKACGHCHGCGAAWSCWEAAELLGVALPRLAGDGGPERRWEIRNRQGDLVAVHRRIDKADDSKVVWWTGPAGEKRLGRRAAALPLYRSEKIGGFERDKPVYVVEGEPAADALVALGVQAVGTVTGASSCPGKEVLADLAGFEVICWPDNDADGKGIGHMERAAQRLAGKAKGVVILEPTGEARGHDAVDLIAGLRAEDLDDDAIKERVATLPVIKAEKARGREQRADDDGGGRRKGKAPQSSVLLELAEGVELFHDGEEPYAAVEVDGHRQVLGVRERWFKAWLRRRYFEHTGGKAPGAQAVQDALGVLEGRALFEGVDEKVHVRIGGDDERILLDLGRPDWSVVEITATGWRIVPIPAIRFRRPAGLLPLPVPERGGSVEDLKRFIGAGTEDVDRLDDFYLIVAWLVAALRPRGPYPALGLGGEAGSGKSTVGGMLQELIDPNVSGLRAATRDERDLAIAARNSWSLGYDNLSRISEGLSDALCRISTGAGFGVRKLYTDDEEQIFCASRPVLFTAIEDVATRDDLIDRSILVTLPRIRAKRCRPEAELWAEFEMVRPRILGALLDAVAVGLRELPKVKLGSYPRMADFAKWITACAPALPFTAEQFLNAYMSNRDAAMDVSLSADPVADAILSSAVPFEGTASELLKVLSSQVPETVTSSRRWPSSPRALAGRLRRIAPALRGAEFSVEFAEVGHEKRKVWRIGRVERDEVEEIAI